MNTPVPLAIPRIGIRRPVVPSFNKSPDSSIIDRVFPSFNKGVTQDFDKPMFINLLQNWTPLHALIQEDFNHLRSIVIDKFDQLLPSDIQAYILTLSDGLISVSESDILKYHSLFCQEKSISEFIASHNVLSLLNAPSKEEQLQLHLLQQQEEIRKTVHLMVGNPSDSSPDSSSKSTSKFTSCRFSCERCAGKKLEFCDSCSLCNKVRSKFDNKLATKMANIIYANLVNKEKSLQQELHGDIIYDDRYYWITLTASPADGDDIYITKELIRNFNHMYPPSYLPIAFAYTIEYTSEKLAPHLYGLIRFSGTKRKSSDGSDLLLPKFGPSSACFHFCFKRQGDRHQSKPLNIKGKTIVSLTESCNSTSSKRYETFKSIVQEKWDYMIKYTDGVPTFWNNVSFF